MAEGLSDRGIAERLTVSLQTVYTHVQHVFAKLELPATSSDNRRVRAVVAYLTSRQMKPLRRLRSHRLRGTTRHYRVAISPCMSSTRTDHV